MTALNLQQCAGPRLHLCPTLRSRVGIKCASFRLNSAPAGVLVIETDVVSGTRVHLGVDGRPMEGVLTPEAAPPPAAAASLATLRSFFLPKGWPTSVTDDYLMYQIYTFPSHITGWMSSSLVNSGMLRALGVSASPAATAGFSAGIKWVTKDGVGALGRLFVGAKLSAVFDEDPRRWRMTAEAFTTVGLALEIATSLSPANFVVLAGVGTLSKATGRGMGRPCFRVIQTHFSSANNVGDVAAKEEVWEVAAQLLGLAASVAVLTVLEGAGAQAAIVPVWAAVHAAHVGLRYAALAQLRFPYPNLKRGAALVRGHVADGSVLSVADANVGEPVLATPQSIRPRAVFGCSVAEAVGSSHAHVNAQPPSTRHAPRTTTKSESSLAASHISEVPSSSDLAELLKVYNGERYALTWRDGTAHVLLWEDATPTDMLQALWQAAWLDAAQPEGTAGMAQLHASLDATRAGYPGLCTAAAAAGWQLHLTVLPTGSTRLQRPPL